MKTNTLIPLWKLLLDADYPHDNCQRMFEQNHYPDMKNIMLHSY
jgi:hypothetical protein